jgi:hypothetical protein
MSPGRYPRSGLTASTACSCTSTRGTCGPFPRDQDGSPELDALILEHLSDIDAAAKRLNEVEERVFGAMDAAASEWAKEHGWAGVFEYRDNEMWLAPPDWRKPDTPEDEDRFSAWFQLELAPGTPASSKPPRIIST